MRKLLSAALAVLLLIGCVSPAAFAAGGEKSGFMYLGGAELSRYDPSVYYEVSENPVSQDKFFSSGADSPYLFYSFLNVWQKQVYDEVLSAGVTDEFTVELSPVITCTATVENGYLVLPDETSNQLMEIVIGGLSAVSDDHPEIFWINGFGYSMYFQYSYNSDGTYAVSINALQITATLNQGAYPDMASVSDYYGRMMEALDSFEVNGFTRYEKVKSIHDRIVTQVQYDANFSVPTAHEPTSVFLEPYTTVCEGYAEAFKMLCNREGIPCVIIVGNAGGGGHAWNYVKMEDGKWYAVDSTWDDPVGNSETGVFYDFFLVGANSTNRYFDNNSTTFEDAHTPTGKHYTSAEFSLAYPELSDVSYSNVLNRISSSATVRKAHSLIYIDKDAVLSNELTTPYGYTLSINGKTTGATVTVTGAGGSQSYTAVRRGDVDCSLVTDSFDVELISKAARADFYIEDGSAVFCAADMNSDGAVDAFDAIAADLYTNGMLSYN